MRRRSGKVGVTAAIGLLWQAAPARTGAIAVVTLCGATVFSLLVLVTGALIGSIPAAVGSGLGSPAGRHMLLTLTGFAVLAVLQVLLTSLGSGLGSALRLSVARTVDERIIAASLGPSGIAHLEQPVHADHVRLATSDGTRPDLIAQCLDAVVRPRLQAVGLVVILARFAWWAPALLTASAALTYWQYLRISATVHGSMKETAEMLRRADYFRDLATDPGPAKEIRLFGLGGWLVARMTHAWHAGMAPVWTSRRAATRRAHLTAVCALLAEALVLVELALAAARGHLGVSAIAIYAQAAVALPLLAWVGDPDYLFRQGMLGLRALARLQRPGDAGSANPNGTATLAGDQPRHEILLDSVRFAYPGSDRNALDGLSLRIPAGRSVAVVGANGAGKTTLIKLLARLYDPDAGRISIDGIDLRDLDPGAWRRHLAVVFQDFVKYPLPLRANIGFGDLGKTADLDALNRALTMAGGGSLPGSLPAGWDTVLSPEFGGTDLSGGQWQWVALARALLGLRPGSVLILDEPTANLDVRAESELFERLLALTRGTTTVLISHRLSAVRKADLIYVLDEGRVAEAGSHSELMALNGRYAEMFRIQAAPFRPVGHDPLPVPEPPPPPAAAAPPVKACRGSAPGGGLPETGRRGLGQGLASLRLLFAGTFRQSRRLGALAFLLVPAAAMLGSLQAVWLQLMVNGTAHRLLATTVAAAVLLAATRGAWRAITLIGSTARISLSERVGFSFDRRLAETTAAIPGLQHHESPLLLDRLHTLRTGPLGMGNLLNWLINMLEELGGFAIAMALLATVYPLLLVVPLAGIITLRLQILGQLTTTRSEDAAGVDYRLAAQLVQLTTTLAAGKEIRVFRTGAELHRLYRESRCRADGIVRRAQWRATVIGAASGLLTTLSTIAAVGCVAALATDGKVGLGAVLLAFTLASGLIERMAGLVQATGIIARLLRNGERFRWLRSYAQHVQPPPPSAPVPAALRDGITLEAVWFHYPGTAAPALRDINLHLPAGSVVALVGHNGAGKTTLVKLLCRYYEPTAGRIRIDTADLNELDIQCWRRSLSGVFQDFARPELLAREAVGVGDLPHIGDQAAIGGAVNRAGATGLIRSLSQRLNTQLGAQWDGGTDLSSGQWQKLALSRGLMRAHPLLLLLDEPTAALDAQTESALYERFSVATRISRLTGTITVLVTHRFSTVRMADLIIVLDDGAVAELGTHGQLLARQGRYAGLYGLQAHAYQ